METIGDALAKFKAALDAARNSKKTPEQIEKAKELYDSMDPADRSILEYIFPEVVESEDEKIRNGLIHHLQELREWKAGSMSPIKTKDHYDAWITYLENQKEQKPVDPSDEETQRHQDKLYNFKVFAAKQAKEHHISFVHDFEWNNFCAEILSYFNEQQKPVFSDDIEREIRDWWLNGWKNCTDYSSFKSTVEHFYNLGKSKQKPAEWSEEDEEIRRIIINRLTKFDEWASKQGYTRDDPGLRINPIDWFKSLRPHWKPSEEQMKAIKYALGEGGKFDKEALELLYNDLKKL